MRESSKSALGGIVAALSVVLMLMTYISPFLVYAIPALAGLLTVVIAEEIGYRWAIGTFAAVSLLSFFLIADKEAAVFYVFFFGYYPILQKWMAVKLGSRRLCLLCGAFIYDLALAAAIFISAFVFRIDYSDLTDGGKWMFWTVLGLMQLFYFIYDLLLRRIVELYRLRLQKKIRQIFR